MSASLKVVSPLGREDDLLAGKGERAQVMEVSSFREPKAEYEN